MNEDKAETTDPLIGYQTRRLQDLIEEIHRCCKEQATYLSSKFDVPEAELRCLMLFSGERYLTSTGISQKLDVAKSRVTKVISGLLQKELVQIVDDPQDARIKLILLTQEGQRKSREISAIITDLHKDLLLEFDPEQRKTVLSCLDVLRSGMEAVKKQLV
jgi:DNA-binding MarR family transcriptional regulator